MKKSALEIARKLLKRRKFSQAIAVLESREDLYKENFEYHLLMGIACLYGGEIGNASSAFAAARNIKISDPDLLLGQAAIFLRRGDTNRAVQYYLDVFSIDPGNVTAAAAMEFLQNNSNFDTICQWVDSGRIEKFYPPLGVNPDIIRNIILGCAAAACCVCAVIFFKPSVSRNWVGPRANLESFVLTEDEKKQTLQEDLSGTVVHYMMSSSQIQKSYENAMEYFEDHRDNASQVEINRILNSNASLSIKHKASALMTYLEKPTFDTLASSDNFTYSQVMSDVQLYMDCYVSWTGRISNAQSYENGSYSCDLLVGYEDMKKVEGIVPVFFKVIPAGGIDGERPVRILAQISTRDGKLLLEGVAVYQPLKGSSL